MCFPVRFLAFTAAVVHRFAIAALFEWLLDRGDRLAVRTNRRLCRSSSGDRATTLKTAAGAAVTAAAIFQPRIMR